MRRRIMYWMVTAALGVFGGHVRADECATSYWQITPSTHRCSGFKLPDFTFRPIPQHEDAPEHIKRFCSRFEVRSQSGTQETGYCYTGDGDRTGPSFSVGGKEYQADLNFVGCLDGVKREGVVFTQGGWIHAPKNLKRLWPVDSLPRKVSCD